MSLPSLAITQPQILTKEIQDLYIRKNFQNLVAYFASQNQLLNFGFFEINVTQGVSSPAQLNHNLGYIPKDVIISQITGSGTIQFLYGSFTRSALFYTATGPCRVRFFVGTYFQDNSQVTAKSTDIQSAVSTPATESVNSVVSATGTYTLTGTEYLLLMTTGSVNGASQALVTLPDPIFGTIARVQKVDNNSNPVVTRVKDPTLSKIIPTSGTTYSLTVQWSSIELVADGTNWRLYNKWSGS